MNRKQKERSNTMKEYKHLILKNQSIKDKIMNERHQADPVPQIPKLIKFEDL